MQLFVFSISLIASVGFGLKLLNWRRHYVTAKTSKFPVLLSPVHIRDLWWLVLYPILVPLLNCLPKCITIPWLPLAQAWNIWKFGYQPFEEVEHDSFLLSTPRGNILWTCDAKVVNQVYLHPGSQIVIDMVDFFDIYGPTVASVEGHEWKRHRQIITPGFNSATYSAVWSETIHQTTLLLSTLRAHSNNTLPATKEWTSRLALHVISATFFHKTLSWDRCENEEKERARHGHQLRFDEAMFTVLARIGTLYVTPRVILRWMPFKIFREAHLSLQEWSRYMIELRSNALERLDSIAGKRNRSMVGRSTTTWRKKSLANNIILESIVLAGSISSDQANGRPFSEQDVLGNLFFTIMAGHETVGNTMAFALDLLAIYPEYQRKIMLDIDRRTRQRPFEGWTVEQDFQVLYQGWTGAVIKEVQRLYSVVTFNPRLLTTPTSVSDSKGTSHIIPANTICIMNFGAAFRNPHVWSRRDIPLARRAALHNSPALDFDPSRWLDGSGRSKEIDDTVPLHFPFAQGTRTCPGRLFAQIEMTATLATILVSHSLELVVDDRTIQSCDGDRQLAWEKTRDSAMRTLVDDVEANITLQLHKPIPIKLVKR